ncbi:DNA polymerase IV [Fusarium beomiforme]|uniref:DNA-directed DNA polymerase n=1 Tax=Fusarium beomiforme TaxID=44412 RepID=A0A9P5ACH4_9HYPO|nr:DNA polymerase IV [Fusarium beomiforme]
MAMGGDGDARGATQLQYNGTGATGANPLDMDVNICLVTFLSSKKRVRERPVRRAVGHVEWWPLQYLERPQADILRPQPGDIAWMLSATALVLLMVPGVGFFYSGLARRKSALSLIWLSVMSAAVTTFQWFFWGFSLTFSHTAGPFIGDLSNFGFRDVLARPSVGSAHLPDMLFAVYQGMFSALTVSLATGAVAERGRMLPCIIFVFVWATVVYDPIACWTWNPNGWSNKMGGLDFAGGTPVHIASGSAALAYSMMLGKRSGHGTHELNYRPHNTTHIVTGTVFLWVGWFGFNAGSALSANLRAVMAAVVTHLAACVGGMTWCLLDYRLERKFSTVGFCSGVVAGLVCITPGSGYVPPWAAVIFGVLGAAGSNYATKVKFLLGIDDALDIFAVHGIGGLIGNICTAFFATPSIAALDGYSRIKGGWVEHHWAQMGYQLADSICGGLYSFVVTCIILFLMNLIPGLRLRVDADAEVQGIDDAEIGEFAYDYVELTREVVSDVDNESGSRYSADPTAFHQYEKNHIPMIDALSVVRRDKVFVFILVLDWRPELLDLYITFHTPNPTHMTIAFFDQLKPFYSDDELDAKQQKERTRSRRFFAAKAPPKQRAKEPVVLDLTRIESQKSRATPRRVISLPTPAPAERAKVIKGTPMTALGQKSKLNMLMNQTSAGAILVDDTPIPDSTRKTQRSLPRGMPTSLLPPGRSLDQMIGDSPSPSLVIKKRKRESSIKLRPENEQIFKELTFYYVPDDDIAPARRMRITKAREFGVTWVRTPRFATHIIVEKHIQYKDIESVLKNTNKNLPPKVVNEEYPIDCIQFKALLQCTQKKYRLRGQPMVQEEDNPPHLRPSFEESDKSLQVKSHNRNLRKWDFIPLTGTPERSEESSHRSQGAETPIPTDSQPVVLDLEGMVSSHPLGGERATISRQSSTIYVQKPTVSMQPPQDHHHDELSEYIKIISEYKDLPLDADDDDAQTVTDMGAVESEEQTHSGSEDEGANQRRSRRKTRSGRKDIAFEDRFSCNSAGVQDAKAGNPNARTIEILQSMADYYNRVDDHWRTTAYRKVISSLKHQETKITTAEEAQRLPSVGTRLAQKIEEIVTTDRLQRLEYVQKEPMDDALQLFLGIYGVGNSQARQWLAQGFRTLDDLKAKVKLSPNQLIGIEHYQDLNTRIPRREVEALGAVVKNSAQRIDPQVELIIGGSYRRGAETSGDIDFIITKSNTESSAELRPFLDSLVQRLEAEEFLVARLASSRSVSDGSKWHGCCVLPKISGFNDENYKLVWRRIDFLLVPESEMGAALIYFTGNDIFNRSMRLLASKKGMRLNQRGLYKDVMPGPQRVKVTEGELVEGRDERKIFDILGVKWREPHERWC